ncbi:MAG: threonine synthase, partial [Bacillota bacterium]
FAEPASAASVAGLLKLAREEDEGWTPPDGPVVCVLTGHGLKDIDTALRAAAAGQGTAAEGPAVLEEEPLPPEEIVARVAGARVRG